MMTTTTTTTAATAMMRITVAWSPAARRVTQVTVELPEGGTVRDAVRAADVASRCPELIECGTVGVAGRRADGDRVLRDGERVEVLRPLKVDPKTARRERFRRQGVRAAGLFAARGAKTTQATGD